MSICWYCYWGWPKPIADIYNEAVKRLSGNEHILHFGPSHVVWEDENFDLSQWCLDNFDRYTDGYSKEDLEIVEWSLGELLKLPDNIINAEPEDYDGYHPELFPPSAEMVRI